MEGAFLSRDRNGMSMNILVSLGLMAVSVHCNVTIGFVAVPSDSILPLQVCMDEHDFCWLSYPFANQYRIQMPVMPDSWSQWKLYCWYFWVCLCLFGEWILRWSNAYFWFILCIILVGIGIALALWSCSEFRKRTLDGGRQKIKATFTVKVIKVL